MFRLGGDKMAKNMTEGVPIKLILSFAAPMLLGNIFQQVYNLTDTAIVGKFVGENALAAVGSAGSTTFLIFALVMGLCNGGGIIISQYYGSEDMQKMKRAVVSLWIIALSLGICMSVLGIFVAAPILRLLKTPDNILTEASKYVRIMFIGMIITSLYNACSAILRGLGDSKPPLYSLIASSITNIALDLLFVIKFNWGVSGVAWATVIAQLVSFIVCVWLMYKRHEILHISKDEIVLDFNMIKKIFHMGIPTAFQSSLISLGGLSVQRLINSFGEATIAAYTAANKIDSIAIQFVVAIGISMSTFTGQNIGARKLDRIKAAVKQVLAVMLGGCIVIAAAVLAFKEKLLMLFIKNAESSNIIEIASEYLTIVVIAYVIAGIMQTFLNVLRGAGDVEASMLAGIVELSARIIFAYILSAFLETTGIWLATPLSWGTACLFTVLRYLSGKWKSKRLS